MAMLAASRPYRSPFESAMLVVVPLWLALHAAAVHAEPAVSVIRSGASYLVDVRMEVRGDPSLSWSVLSDYDNLQRFVPGMQLSRIVSGREEPLLLEQRGEAGLLFFKISTTTVSRIVETPLREIRFDLVRGNLRRMQGAWTLAPHDHATTVGCRAELIPEFALPPLIGPAVITQNVRAMVEGVAREIERRSQSSSRE